MLKGGRDTKDMVLEVLDNAAVDGILSGDFLVLKEELVNYCVERKS